MELVLKRLCRLRFGWLFCSIRKSPKDARTIMLRKSIGEEREREGEVVEKKYKIKCEVIPFSFHSYGIKEERTKYSYLFLFLIETSYLLILKCKCSHITSSCHSVCPSPQSTNPSKDHKETSSKTSVIACPT